MAPFNFTSWLNPKTILQLGLGTVLSIILVLFLVKVVYSQLETMNNVHQQQSAKIDTSNHLLNNILAELEKQNGWIQQRDRMSSKFPPSP